MADDSMKETCSWLRIEIQGLSKRFGDVAAVDDLSFSAHAGAAPARGCTDLLPLGHRFSLPEREPDVYTMSISSRLRSE